MSDEDDKISRGLGHVFSPDWAHNLGTKLGEKLKGTKAANAAQEMAQRYIAYVRENQDKAQPVPIVQEYDRRAYPNREKDAELQDIKDRVEEAKRRLAVRDMGDVDAAPAPRPPIQMQREFSNDAEREAYIERIRQAQKNVAKGSGAK